MLEKIVTQIRRNHWDVIINTFGNYLNVFFTAFFALLLVRILNPSQYGVLSVLLGIAYVLANVLDFGTTATIYSYLPGLLEKKRSSLYRFIKSTFFYQSLFSLIVITVLFIFFPTLDKVFFKTKAPTWELYLTAFSVLFFIWQNFALNLLFAAKKFLKANLYLNLSNLLKTLVMFFLILTGNISVGSIIFIFGIVGPVIFFFLLFLEKKDLVFILIKSEVAKEDFRFGYTLTYFIASQFLNLGMRMDLFLLSYFRSKPEVGFYGLAQRIILTVMTTVISITQVLSPAFSKITNRKEAIPQFKKGLIYLLFPSVLFLALFLLPDWVYYLFFTEKFKQTAAITKTLSLPFILYCLGNLPLLFLLYTVKKPVYILYSNVVFFVILTTGCWLLIPKMGVGGPPYALAISLFVSNALLTIAAYFEYKKLPA